MARRRVNTTKLEIVQLATKLFLELGFSSTTPKMICDELDISTGNLTYYFPTKEHLLCVLAEMLCDFQWKMFESVSGNGYGSISSICIEMMTVASACEENEIARDFFTAVFESEICRNYLRNNHVERAKQIFAKECEGWTDLQFEEAELLVMGLQYTTVAASDANIPLKTKIAGALDRILDIYQVDKETRMCEIENVLQMDCRGVSKRVLSEFIAFVDKTNNEALDEIRMTIRKREQTKRSKIPVLEGSI